MNTKRLTHFITGFLFLWAPFSILTALAFPKAEPAYWIIWGFFGLVVSIFSLTCVAVAVQLIFNAVWGDKNDS